MTEGPTKYFLYDTKAVIVAFFLGAVAGFIASTAFWIFFALT